VKPVLLDLFCGAGGCTKGYQEAGFHVVGVDIKPQPNYCGDAFVQMDALDALRSGVWWSDGSGERLRMVDPDDFDAIHASPPCQNYTAYNRRPDHVQPVEYLIEPTRELCEETGLPFIIENVRGAALRNPVQLCGSSFGLDVRRHRLFETSFPILTPPCNHAAQEPGRFPGATNRPNGRATVEVGVWRIPLEVQQRAMGIDWMALPELSQAIPPAYTRFIGEQLQQHLAHHQQKAAA
jgi:DNA (cytosine-5)-methyltransferase 1